jgi:hypothetical protein
MPLLLGRQRARLSRLLEESGRIREDPCLLFSTKRSLKFLLSLSMRSLDKTGGRSAKSHLQKLFYRIEFYAAFAAADRQDRRGATSPARAR